MQQRPPHDNQFQLSMMKSRKIAFVTSCLNEEGNVDELYARCLKAFKEFATASSCLENWEFSMTIADNCSVDGTAEKLKQLASRDGRVQVLFNSRNYGPEPSVVNACSHTQADILVLLTSDLQDPPELVVDMLTQLEDAGKTLDAVLAFKSRSRGAPLVRMCRSLYYALLGYSSRLRHVPRGFHGFGVYRRESIEEAAALWETTGLNLRLCLVNSCQRSRKLPYQQGVRRHGRSSYQGLGYPREAFEALLSADSTASRLAFILSGLGVIASVSVGLFLLLMWLSGNSRYERGTPTVMALVLGSFAMQMLMVAVLSRQVEELRLTKLRPKVRSELFVYPGTDHDAS